MVARSQSVSPLGYPCISREVLVKASQRYGVAETKLFEVLEEKPRPGGLNGFRAEEFIASSSKRRSASSLKTGTSFTTAALVRNFSAASVTCRMFSWILRRSRG
jgi:hypothetical protein